MPKARNIILILQRMSGKISGNRAGGHVNDRHFGRIKEVRIVIIYISDEENKTILNRSAEQYDWELMTQVMDKGSLNLKKFIEKKLQVIANLQYLVMDRSCISESDQELQEVIETIRVIWETHIILLVEELADENGEEQKVIYDEHITYLYKYQDNLAGNIEYLLKGEKIPAEAVYEGIWIGVMAANSGAGATHISIGLANYIRRHGERVCYVEANESGDLGAMAAFYGMEEIEENHYRKDGVDYWHQSVDPEKKFAVLDLGKYNSNKLTLFHQCKIKILVTDGKPYRMADALNVLRYIEDENTRLWLNFINSSEEYEKVKEEYLGGIQHASGTIGWHKDMFLADDILYQEALKEYIHISPGKQSKIAFILNPGRLKVKKKHPVSGISRKKQQPADTALDPIENQGEVWETERGIVQSEDVPGEILEKIPENVPEDVPEEIPKEISEEIPEEDFVSDLEEQEELPEIKEDKSKKRKPVKNNLVLFLVMAAAVFGTWPFMPQMKQLASRFSFNRPDTEQVTEVVDDDLNMNPEIKISVQEVEGADGYEVSYSTNKDFDKKTTVIVEVETADKAVESLTAGKTYYVRIRAFKFNEDGTKVYGEYTDVQKIET